MKKLISVFIATILLLSVSTQKSKAQTLGSEHEITIGIGFVTTDQIVGVLIDITRTLGTLGSVQSDNINYTGAIYVDYKHYFTPRLSAGLSIVSDRAKGDLVNDSDELLGTFRRSAITLAPEMSFSYLNSKSFRLYGSLGLGYTFGNETSTNDVGEEDYTASYNHFNFQVTPIGFRLGGQIGAFAEIGFGYKGIIGVGVSGYF